MSGDMDHEARGIQRLARITGLLYLVVAIFGMFAGTISTGLVVAGDPAATADKVLGSAALFRGAIAAWVIVLFADVAVAVSLWVLLRPAGRTLSGLAALLRVVYVAIQAVNLLNLCNVLFLLTDADYRAGFSSDQVNALASFSLEAFGTGFRVGLLFFGAHLVAVGYLLFASRSVPRGVSILVVTAGIGYMADSLGRLFVPGYSAVATAVFLTPAAAGELGLTAWLLVKGVQVRQPAALPQQEPRHAQGPSVMTV